MEQSELSGGDQFLRTSTLIRDRPDRGEEQGNLQGESDGSSSTPLRDSSWYDEEAKSDFRTITGEFIYRHHVVPRVKLYVPKGEPFLIPLKYIDVTRNTDTALDVLLEKDVEDCWNVDGERKMSDAWTGFTRFVLPKERPPEGYTWSGKRLTRKQTTSRARHFVARVVETCVRCIETRRKAKVGNRETKTRKCQKITWYLLQWTWWWRTQAYNEECS